MPSITTGRRASKNLAVWGALLALAAIGAAGCDKVPLLAPSGSTVTLSTSSSIVQANGAAEIRATVLESSGTPVQNGTTVTFSTNLGTMSPAEARTVNGVATAQFVPNGQSGTAKIVATSGAAKADTTSNPLTISVGSAAASRVLVTAAPSRISAGGISTITATVTDTNGNALSGITVAFTTNNGAVTSVAGTTNASGQASTSVTTSKDAIVTATVGGSSGTTTVSGTVTVTVGVLPTLAFGTVTPANPTPGQNVTIPLTVTTTGATDAFQNVTVNFGDGSSRSLGPLSGSTSVSHAYLSDGVYTVTATGVGSNGDQTQAITQVAINPRTPVGITLTATPNPTTRNTLVTFTAAFDGTVPANISGYDWNFGDGSTRHTTGRSTQYAYPAVSPAGGYSATVDVDTTDGNSGNAQTQVIVNP
ncbi:MAG TPA: Ig-like domain-containing protein [Vicinamibacterales bacterium]|nr:Ig-like domain-containing protein [Vicinamibacterales bacterium]